MTRLEMAPYESFFESFPALLATAFSDVTFSVEKLAPRSLGSLL